ncbi:Spy/CpxP family protein refolding chaperone [Microbulbifer thermotolerans]|uniref:Spy/CpxP family protein refolding chaperone n=1 Tax=Microbulbifer thermotolerans TaxID=252514 RepID=UPI002672E542|nr:Spy/CpxP family protein refolding chaperone [Microbulbifer thermotolerans]WKT61782.1 Spy/CpxP family protein refolding chaperone [Microbulbifer thermotolerans]
MKNWKAIAGSVILAGALAAPAATLAFGGGQGPHHHKGHYMEHIAEELNLTEGQKAQLKANREAAREAHKAQRKQKRELHKKLREAIASGADQATLDSLGAELGRLQVAEMQQRHKQRQQFEAILTDEQKAKLEKLKVEREERRMERRGKRGEG